MNSWPGGRQHAMYQSEHEEWNARYYPGTRQLCSACDQPTGRCEDDSLYVSDVGPLCEECWKSKEPAREYLNGVSGNYVATPAREDSQVGGPFTLTVKLAPEQGGEKGK